MSARSRRDANRRALGQNFLTDQNVIAEVVGTIHPPPGATVVDLGAGKGALTAAAARLGARVIAVERDPHWVQALRAGAAEWGDVEVVAGDILDVALPSEPFYVVSNAPFGIGTQVLRRLLTDAHGLVRASVVLQREAALRLAGRPRTGRFAATWAPWFALEVRRRIPARAFRPIPGVDAAILTAAPREVPLLSPAAYASYDAFLAALFAGGGTTVGDRLGRRIGRRPALAVLDAVGVSRSAPPLAVEPKAYALLFLEAQARSGTSASARQPQGRRKGRRASPSYVGGGS